MNAPTSPPDDATLVAWLDGELPADTDDAVALAVRRDAALGRRVDLLRAARAELLLALAPDATDVRPTHGGSGRAPRRRFGAFLLAAAAMAIVLVIAGGAREPQVATANNTWLELKLTTQQPAWPLFSAVRFTLTGRALTDTPCRVLPRGNDYDSQVADRAFADEPNRAAIPLVLTAEVTGPDGVAWQGDVARVAGGWAREAADLTVELADVLQPAVSITPIVNVAIEPDGPREDFRWGMQRLGSAQVGGRHGCVPFTPGAYRIRFTLRGLTLPGDSRWPAFGEPLSVAIGFQLAGVVGEWGEPQDGLRARIVANTDRPTATLPLVVALQLRNESDRPREFNVTGTTLAKIPQPFHFDLMVDGVQWQQRERLGVITDAMSLALPLAVGAERSLLVLADYWRREGKAPTTLRGVHRVGFRFHFEATAWLASDTALWQGKIDTPPIEVTFGGR